MGCRTTTGRRYGHDAIVPDVFKAAYGSKCSAAFVIGQIERLFYLYSAFYKHAFRY